MSETFIKKEFKKKKLQKQQEKEKRREERKLNNDKGKNFKEMFMYVDEFGRLVETPPSEEDHVDVELSDIQLGAAPLIAESPVKSGTVSFVNSEKEYGFINHPKTGENLFFHFSNCAHPVKMGNKVSFEKVRSPKGFAAVNVQMVK